MAYGNVKYVGDGSTKVFSIPFPYLDITHVKVYVNGILQNNVTYPTESQVELPVAPAEGAVIAVVRETPKERLVDFQNASILDEKTLDLDSNQMMYIVQESLDKSEDALVVDLDNAYDAQGRRIKNLADPKDDQDAVTKHFADQVLAQAQTNADAARASAQAAQVAESNAKSHRDTALAAANTATSAANQAVTEVNKIRTLQHQAAILKPEGGKLWHFDTSLESTDGIKPLEGVVATLRPNEGRFGGAVAVEEETTNLIPSPRWYRDSRGQSSDWCQRTVYSDHHWKVEATGTANNQHEYYCPWVQNVTPNTEYTFSFRVKQCVVGHEIKARVRQGDNQTTLIERHITAADVGKIVSLTINSGDSTSLTPNIIITVNTGQYALLEISDIQFEAKPFATSFVDGTRAAGKLEYPGVFQQGTISAWVYLNKEFLQSLPTTDSRCLLWGNTTSSNAKGTASFYYYRSGQYLRYRVVHADGSSDINAPVPETGWHHFVTIMHGDKMALYIDGEKVNERKINVPMPSNNTLQVGSASTGGHGNFLFDELLILPYAATEEEIKGWYEAKKPFIDQDEISTIGKKLKTHMDAAHNVKSFGAKGDRVTDDTTAIQAAIDAAAVNGGTVYFPAGIYLVDPVTAVDVKSNVTLIFSSGAVLQAKTNDAAHYQVLRIHDQENVKILYPTIIGDRDTHTGSTGEWGMGISIRGSSNVLVVSPHVSNCWGDGIYIGSTATQTYSENVRIIDPVCDNNRRQGISLISGKDVKIIRPRLLNTNGTAPEAGLDIEPNDTNDFLEDIVIDKPYTAGNSGNGIVIHLNAMAGSGKTVDITIQNHVSDNDRNSFSATCTGTLNGTVNVLYPIWKNATYAGCSCRAYEVTGPELNIVKPVVVDPNQIDSASVKYSSVFTVYRESTDDGTNKIGNINILEPDIIITGSKLPTGFLFVNDYKNTGAEKVKVINPLNVAYKSGNNPVYFNCENGVVEDSFNKLLLEVNANATIGVNNYYKKISSRLFTANRTFTLAKLPIGFKITFECWGTYYLTIDPEATDSIEPLGNGAGKYVRSNEKGARLTIEKIDADTWFVVEQIGTWEAEA